MYSRALGLILLIFSTQLGAQSSAEIFHEIEKFNTHTRVLYMAAHPDDENTAVIAWMANDKKAKTAYLSLTRGDGGQNLIGTEMGPLLGVLRTQELLAARSIDGGEQFFTRAVDFGYSKTAKESLAKWGHNVILNDAVFIIRHFKPDVIITRFPPDKRAGHGHHTSSAMLAVEAYTKAADENYKTESPSDPWQVGSVYWNTSTWWGENLDSLMQVTDLYVKEDIGGFDPVIGVNYNELGSKARSQHKCQGFGVKIDRGERIEYFKWLAGEKLNSTLLENATRSWESIGMEKSFIKMSKKLQSDFDFEAPQKSLPILIKMRNSLHERKEDPFVKEKLDHLNALIVMCSGLYVEGNAQTHSLTQGEELVVSVDILNRRGLGLYADSAQYVFIDNYKPNLSRVESKLTLTKHIKVTDKTSNKYWLQNDFSTTYQLAGQDELLNPDNLPTFTIPFAFGIMNKKIKALDTITIQLPVLYKWSDRVEGEHKRPVNITPQASVEIMNKSLIYRKGETGTVNVRVKHYMNQNGFNLKLQLPEGWQCSEPEVNVAPGTKYQEQLYSFEIIASEQESQGELKFSIDGVPAVTLTEIAYNHIPTQLVALPAKAKVVALDLQIKAGRVAYIEGAGDEVAEAIEQMGFEVDVLDKTTLSSADLSKYQAVVLGIRAYNVNPWLFDLHEKFMKYVLQGGNMIVQYNTSSRWSKFDASAIGPFPFEIGRNRVSEEDAEPSFIGQSNLLLFPNQIGEHSFDNWVQERGLYFARKFNENYNSVISWHDEGEDPQEGGLIYADYGEGVFIYSGISFFRQLPAGVPGAFKLLANMISYEQ